MHREAVLLQIFLLLACSPPDIEPVDWPDLALGAPVAGAAEGTLDLPVGTPLGGYSSRCHYLGGSSSQDNRASAYTVGFAESTGIQTRPGLKVLWIENGDDHLVLAKADVIYSFDGMVAELTRRLEESTAEDLEGRVILSANHSHASYGPYSDSYHFYLGGDRYDEEIFQRFAVQLTEVALEAWDNREEVSLGTGWAVDWDPEDRVYRDRRGDNDSLAIWDDVEPGYGKDPHLNLLKVERLDGSPMAAVYTFGIHGTSLNGDNSMISSDAPGQLEHVFQEQFEEPVVVMHLQGAGGDASPGGSDDAYARLESVGEYAVDPFLSLWDQTQTSSEPIRMETASRAFPQSLEEIHVSRNGEVDWRYQPYVDGYLADDEIYGEDGEVLSPLDEFNAPYGAAFCGSDSPLIPAGNIGSQIFPYSACMDVELVSWVLLGIFKLDEWGMEEIPLPMPSALRASTTVSRVGPLVTLDPDGAETEEDLLVGFFPGESTAMFTEQWRRRMKSELGHERALHVGYSQDHEGYLLLPEDWLMGGYEPNINLWGPLQAEYLLEGALDTVAQVLDTDVREAADPLGLFQPTQYSARELGEEEPDLTLSAGTRITEVPEYLWLPLDLTASLDTPETVRRVDGIVQMAWEGGDPMVDLPQVSLWHQVDGTWFEATSHSGRAITDAFVDILTAHTPNPLYPSSADQTHLWWTAWQAVGHVQNKTALPTGTYRLQVNGKRYVGGSNHWPWATEDYEVVGDSFIVEPAELSIEAVEGGLWTWIQAPDQGWRLVDLEGDSRGENPVHGEVALVFRAGQNILEQFQLQAEVSGGRSFLDVEVPASATSVEIVDAWGNSGLSTL